MSAPTIHARFAEQAGRTPDATAVVEAASGAAVTYRQLEQRSSQLAHRLISRGIAHEDRIAVLAERSIDLVVAFLAILKAGACFVPIHDAYPAERQRWVIRHSVAALLIADTAMEAADVACGLPVEILSDPSIGDEAVTYPDVAIHPDQLAYVIHTSGSTGQPKGVGVTQREVVRLLSDPQWLVRHHERRLLVLPHAFDISVFEIWMPLIHGGQLILGPHGRQESSTLRELITAYQITGMHLTAGLFRVIAEGSPETFIGLGEIVTGGDVIASTAVTRVLEACPDVVVLATYGATEGTVMSTQVPLSRGMEVGPVVPLGTALTDVTLHLLSDHLAPTPTGSVGEIYLAGAGVARGYLGQADLTSHRFVADPFGLPGSRMYRTGDLARRTGEGTLEFVGREDSQVKIHGFLVEPAEVEAALADCPGLAQFVVLARELGNGEKQLIGYAVPDAIGFSLPALRAYARTKLPYYMVPARFVELASLPITANGKLDRGALSEPHVDHVSGESAPRTSLERTLCEVFRYVLDTPEVGIDQNFFERGGQSLQAVHLVDRISAEIGVEIPLDTIYKFPTVAELAEQVEAMSPPTT